MAKERNDLAEDAVKINGAYLEDGITGYKTIKAVGRELVERELETTDSRNDGAVLRNARYKERTIEVTFYVKRNNLENFRASMETLKSKLNVKDARIIFNGDPNFYFTATPTLDDSFTETKNGIVGRIIFTCMDPCKYSVAETEVSPTSNVWTITYDGTYKSHPRFVFDFPATYDANGDNTDTSQCGYVGLANQAGAMLQFGDPEAVDWADVTNPATIPLTHKFSALTGWTQNSATMISTDYVEAGTAAVSSNAVSASGYGSGTKFHGPSILASLTDVTTAKNFVFQANHEFDGSKNEYGCFQCLLYNNNAGTRTLIAGFNVKKTTKNKDAKVYVYGGTNKTNAIVKCENIKASTITKEGTNLLFNVGKIMQRVVLDSTTADMVVNEVVFYFGKNASKTAMTKNKLSWCQLMRSAYDKFEDIPNVFMPGNKLTVDCNDASVYLDSGDAVENAQSIGALGNDWETFVLTPGTNVIQVEYSDWTTTPPVAKLKYRKVYL